MAVPARLDFDQQGSLAGNNIEQLPERWNRITAAPKVNAAKLHCRSVPDGAMLTSQVVEVPIMEYDGLAIGGALHVAFDPKPTGDCACCRSQRVFRDTFAVKPAMGKDGAVQPGHAARRGGRRKPAINWC